MKVKKVKCPICKKTMILKDITFDGVKALKCDDYNVTKNFKSWEEQGKYEEIYKLK